jgi:hypothetical protein
MSGTLAGLNREIMDKLFDEMKANGAVIVYIAPNPYILFTVDYQAAFYLEGTKYIEHRINYYTKQTK